MILILGSMPGIESLLQKQYYAHPRNLFWGIMGEMLSFDENISYEERIRLLKINNIALWDVVAKCKRKGSLDLNICQAAIEYNNINDLVNDFVNIKHIFFNGKKAESLFIKQKIQLPDRIRLYSLPSTSPANASISLKTKKQKWSIIKKILLNK